MRKAIVALLATALLALSACGAARHSIDPANPDHYYLLLDYAETLVVYVLAGGCCPRAEAQQWIDVLSERRALFAQESRSANWAGRYEALHDQLVLWIASLRERGMLSNEQFSTLARKLALWRGWRW